MLLLMISTTSFGQNIRGFYLQNVGTWLGVASQEDAILQYAQGNGFNYILLYDLGDITWSNATQKNNLAAFMKKARTQYGVIQFGGVVEYAGYVSQNILPYNNSRASNSEKFNVINLEFEFWVNSSITSSYCSKFLSAAGFSCDTAGAWKFAWRELKLIDDMCAANGMISEFYMGWPNKGQLQQIASRADRILLSAYRPTDSDIYAYSKNRMQDIATIGGTTKILTLLSSETSFMGPWLNSHPQSQPYQTLKSALTAETGTFKNNIDLQGYQWFTYKWMPKTLLASASISANGPLTFCPGGSVTLTANSGTNYLWIPGGQTTQSITVSNAGTFSVKVTSSSGAIVTSSSVTVSNSVTGTIPIISTSGSTSFCTGGSVILSSGSASSYLWSNGATTQSITTSTSGTYTVTTGSGSCSGTSAPVVVNALAQPAIPTVTANGPLAICSGTLVTLTSDVANGYLWSNGATTRSIVVSASGNYSVRVYSGPGCFSTSAVSTISASPSPTVTASGSIAFCPGGSVILTASQSSSYLWSNGATTRAITVSNSGNFSVTTAGCSSASAPVVVNASALPAVPTIAASGSLNVCAGTPLILTSSSANYYLWSNGSTTRSISVTTAGNYSVSASSAPGCSATSVVQTVTILPVPAKPTINSNNYSTLSLTHTLTALTALPASSYLWSNGATTQSIIVTGQGSFRVTVVGSNGCASTSNDFAVTANGCTPPPAPTITLSGSNVITNGQSVTLTSSGSGGFLWSNGAQTNSITVSATGTYTVRNYSGGGCYSTSLPVNVVVMLAKGTSETITENNSTMESDFNNLSVFPNPVHDQLNIVFFQNSEKTVHVKLLDVAGREIQNIELTAVNGENRMQLDVNGLSKGLYFAYFLSESQKKMMKIIVE